MDCQTCKRELPSDCFKSPGGRVCKDCQREKHRLKHARYRRESAKYREYKAMLCARWRKTPKGRATRNKVQRAWASRNRGKVLLTFMPWANRHPDYPNLDRFLAKTMAFCAVELDASNFHDRSLHDLIADPSAADPLARIIERENHLEQLNRLHHYRESAPLEYARLLVDMDIEDPLCPSNQVRQPDR